MLLARWQHYANRMWTTAIYITRVRHAQKKTWPVRRYYSPQTLSAYMYPSCGIHIRSWSFYTLQWNHRNCQWKIRITSSYIRARRLRQSCESSWDGIWYRMQVVCDQIPTTLPDDLNNVGYHRQCYQRFTSNRRSVNLATPSLTSGSTRKLLLFWFWTASFAGPIFPPECIFCGKVEIKIHIILNYNTDTTYRYINKTFDNMI